VDAKARQKIEKRTKKITELVQKKGGTKPGVVIAVPVIQVYQLHAKDDFILLASDGLWDVLSNTEAIAMVGKQLRNQKNYVAFGLGPPKLDGICKTVCNKARARHSLDDITVLIVFLQDHAPAEEEAEQ